MYRRLLIVVVLACVVGLLVGYAKANAAMTLGVQDQGADPAALAQVVGDLGAKTVRVVASPQEPQTALVRRYHAQGMNVQAAILVKKTTTAGDIRGVMRQWHGMVRTVSVGNEPDLNGVPAGTYARLWRASYRMIRREFPGVRVGLGEFSPARGEYAVQVAKRLKGARPAFVAWHPYQFLSDPMAAPTERSGVGSWVGLGNLPAWTRKIAAAGVKAPAYCTEFSYLVDGRYRTPRATELWARAIVRAKRVCGQLIIYGLGCVPKGTWGSAALLDCNGRRAPAFLAIARALGRTLGPEHPLTPTGLLPDGHATDRTPPLPMRDTATGASSQTPDAADDGDEPTGSEVQDPDDSDAPAPGAPAICEDDDVTDEQWDAAGCDAFYQDADDLPDAEPEPGDDDTTDPEGGAE